MNPIDPDKTTLADLAVTRADEGSFERWDEQSLNAVIEQILFPLIRDGRGAMAAGPVQGMELEHHGAGESLTRLRELAHDYSPPEEACKTWRALYLGLAELDRDLKQHIHLENNVLFPQALSGPA